MKEKAGKKNFHGFYLGLAGAEAGGLGTMHWAEVCTQAPNIT